MDHTKNNPGRQGPPEPGAPLATWALAYARIGWPIGLLHPVRKGGRCGCGDPRCPAAGGHAIRYQATDDPETVRRWCARHPQAELAVHLRGADLACVAVSLAGPAGLAEESFEVAFDGPLREGAYTETPLCVGRFYQAPPPALDFPAALPIMPNIGLACGDTFATVPSGRRAGGEPLDWPAGHSPWEAPVLRLPESFLSLPWGRTARAVLPDGWPGRSRSGPAHPAPGTGS